MIASKTPLQAAVVVICDCICQLPPEDQPRALEAVRVTLGLDAFKDPAPPQGYRAPRPQPPLEEDPEPRQPWDDPPARGPLPTVVGQQRDQRRQLPASGLRQLPAPRLLDEDASADALSPGDAPPPAQPRRGYV